MGEHRDKAVKPVLKKVTPPVPVQPPVPAPQAPWAFPGGNAIAALMASATPLGFVPVEHPLDSVVEGNELEEAMGTANHGPKASNEAEGRDHIVEVLRRNSLPRDMYALIRNFHGDLIEQLLAVAGFSHSQWARIQAYLGNQLPLHVQIELHRGDRDAVFLDLQRISDSQAFAMIVQQDFGLVIQPKPETEYDAIPPAQSTRALVEKALHEALPPDGYIQAFRLLLQKAARARWLGETFETTMALVRAAKPKLTEYTGFYQPTKASAPWWEYGDVQDEKAGWPLLDFVGYDPKTRTIEYAAKPNHPGHVLLQEIMTLMNLVGGKTADGQPIEVVRAVFLDEKQARAEKRPLLDNDVKVYYLGKAGELVELTS